MRDFFKPWRRKLGMVTLGLACVFAVGWVRSIFVFDLVTLAFGHCRLIFISDKQNFQIIPQTNRAIWIFINDDSIWEIDRNQFTTPISHFASESSRLRFVTYAEATEGTSIPLIYYWSIVLPLTLLSAWLLLSKPRPAKKPEPSPSAGEIDA